MRPNDSNERKCPQCFKIKSLDEFYKNSRGSCKDCIKKKRDKLGDIGYECEYCGENFRSNEALRIYTKESNIRANNAIKNFQQKLVCIIT